MTPPFSDVPWDNLGKIFLQTSQFSWFSGGLMKPLEKRLFLKIFIPVLILILISWILYSLPDPLMKGAALVSLLFFVTFFIFVIRKQWQNRDDFKIPSWVFITLLIIFIAFFSFVGAIPILTMFTKPPADIP